MSNRRRIWWQKYLYPGQTGLQYEQDYHKLKRHEHQIGEHSKGIVSGLCVTETAPASLLVNVAAGRAIDSNGQEVEIESTQQVDLTSLVPGAGTRTVYIVLAYAETNAGSYFVPELGVYQSEYTVDSYTLQATITAPSDPTLELARVELAAGAAQIVHASDPDSPGNNEIDMSNRVGSIVIGLPTNYIGGLVTSNNAGDASHDIDIAVGVCRDDKDIGDMRLSSVLTKRIDAVWAVGSGNGGLDTGAVAADTMYAIWLIKRSDTGVVDALFSLSFTSPTMPLNYDKKRLIAAVCTDGSSNIIAYTQSGDYFRYMGEIISDVNDNTITSLAWEVGTLSVPPNCIAHIYGGMLITAAPDNVIRLYIRTNGAGDIAGSEDEAFIYIALDAADTIAIVTRSGDVLVDGSSQVQYAAIEPGGATTRARISTMGFTMLTRREP